MSFLAGLLRRELPPAPSAAGAVASTTSALAVVPRLASRFENPGTPWWPGSGDGRDGNHLERLEERDAKEGLRSGTQTGDARRPGNPSRPATGQEGTARPEEAPVSLAHRPWSAPGASALHSSVTERSPRMGMETSPGRPAAADALPMPVSLSTVFSGAGPMDPATASTVPLFAQTTTEDGAGRMGRMAGVVQGMEGMRDNGRADHSHGVGPAVWQGSTEGAVRPRLEPLARREPAKAPEQHIHVSIGRIEVRAVSAPAPQPPARERAGLMGLDEYLRDRS
ncbi:hypothetical protein AS189_14350 [Arthrobacter alpinus]|uniref:Uncharacterized protein n=1 Tax=Arthrobacter alpinus TaxID=656366 RepID=A0A0S2M182_9MICC|nr:hypothetical protein [Arthrobacter alpinus]ALO67455.1 hypothetical protein AS189_14350 [Arthrobacter alpinus]